MQIDPVDSKNMIFNHCKSSNKKVLLVTTIDFLKVQKNLKVY